MADRLVSCPGCAKPYRLPEGVAIPPGSTFPCRVCSAAVPYDAPAAAAPAPAAAPRAARTAAPAARRGREAAKPRGRAAEPAARARPEAAPDPHDPKVQEAEKQKMIMIASISGVVLLVGVFLLVKFLPESRPPNWRSPEEIAAAHALEEKLKAAAAPVVKVPVAVQQAPPTTVPSADSPQVKAILNMLMRLDGYALYRHVESVPDVTADQRAAMDKDVQLLIRKDGGRPAEEARERLLKEGRRAVPSLLTEFVTEWERDKWSTDDEKAASFAVQKLLIEIVKGHRPSDLLVSYDGPKTAATPADFDRVGRMWINWWGVKGKKIEAFLESSQ